ncbi:DUF2029 domain-containing protein [Flavobacterium sp. AS60]|uniref:glycosyltransferase family 87 protein n=1 Tax=Flavobacterium anseongense TaxID=2910677 RepID=UPI001F177387|nr:glycosyltransferase family 87 protein [Flavobacterium sp. AS60]MCF6128462.1 DUF2029 domain-containing protein [Flavobacterium sp. AS60]
MKKSILKYYPLLPLLLLCVFYGYKSLEFPIHDFSNYYFGGKFLGEGHFTSAVYFPYEFNKAISDLGHHNIFASYAPNTPFLAFFFSPFSFISVLIAKLVFNCISISLFVFSIYRLFSHYKINLKYALLIPILFLVPIKNNLLFGQVYFLLFFLLAEGWLSYEKERWKSMAFFWSLAILLKVFPVLLFVLFVFKKQWKALLYLAVSCILLFGISLLFTGADIWIFYLKEVLPKASNGEIATAFVPNYQSVFMFLKELLVFDATDNSQSIFNYPVLFSAVMLAFKIGILGIGYFISKKTSNALFAFSYWILAMILLSPYGSTYTIILLIFPFLALLKSDISNVKKITLFIVLFLISNLSLSLFIEKAFPLSYLRLFLLLLLFVLFLFEFQQKINWKIVTVFSLMSMILVLIFKKNETVTSTILLKNGPILIYDYKIKDNQLTYFYWNEKGENQAVIPFENKSCKAIELNSNQLTFDKNHKLKPILIDNKTVLYLSDYGRGIGFYTLRKMELK